MAELQQLPPRLAFGRFEVRIDSGELFREGVRIRLSAQPFAILLALLRAPGELVSREQLRDQIWGEGTYVDFEHGLNAAVNKLRRALSDSADTPRYIETVPGRGYRFIGTLQTVSNFIAVGNVENDAAAEPVLHGRLTWWSVALLASLIGVLFALGFRRAANPVPEWRLTRITPSTGLSNTPALSRDGSLVAYSSNTDHNSGYDLYVRQVAGGQAVRLTFDGQNNVSPNFSPDGSKIVFRSSRNHGGIYKIPTFGGEAQLLAPEGFAPKFSPDGLQVAYWTGSDSVAIAVPGSGALWVVSASGGQPSRIASGLSSARYPVWSPDGKWLLFEGYDSAKLFDGNRVDWWLVSREGDKIVKTGARDVLLRSGLESPTTYATVPTVPTPTCWLPDDTVIFSTRSGDARNLYQLKLSAENGRVLDSPHRLTTGSGYEFEPSCSSSGSVAFTNQERRLGLWSLPASTANTSTGSGLHALLPEDADRDTPSLSEDGTHVAFSSNQAGVWKVWFRDLQTGNESDLATLAFTQRYPTTSPSGRRVAFSVFEKDKRVVYVGRPGENPYRVCDGCLRATAWSHDEKRLLIFGGTPYQIDIVDVESRQRTSLLTSPNYSLLYGRFSPDDRWVSFTARVQPGRGRIFIAPTGGPQPLPERSWIPVADVDADDYANWSLDGTILYFTSKKDGFSCLWAQRIDPATGRIVGDAFPVQHFHGNLLFDHGGLSVAKDRISIALVEANGNVWVMERK